MKLSIVERLKSKSDDQKRMIALGVSVGITLIIAVVWIVARMAMQN
jgi:hypothetical protein